MKINKLLVIALAVFTAGQAAHAGNSQPKPLYTFLCTGNVEFRVGKCPQGGGPNSLLEGSDNKLYGTGLYSKSETQPQGGTIFSYTAAGEFTVVYTFKPDNSSITGNNPSGLIEGPDGRLYGTAETGGSAGHGLLFRINRDGTGFTVVHNLCSSPNCTDGLYGGFSVVGADGNLYGTTYAGGADDGGTIFRVIPSSGEYDVLFSFGGADGAGPTGVTLGSGGILYGLEGLSLFQYNPANGNFSEAALPFPQVNGSPSGPATGLTIGPTGNLCGLYEVYSEPGIGVFEVNTDGSNFQVLPEFDPNFIHSGPVYMILGSDQNFWVTELIGGTSDGGAIVTVSSSTGDLLATDANFSAVGSTGYNPDVLIQLKNKAFVGATMIYGTAPKGQFASGVIFYMKPGL